LTFDVGENQWGRPVVSSAQAGIQVSLVFFNQVLKRT